MNFQTLIELIFDFTKKASVIARSIRDDENLFSLLIEEKTGGQKNERFTEDFKTLADVLIQQTLSHEIDLNVNMLSGRVYGEECASFNNSLGESITVSIQETKEKTAELLGKVLNNNKKAADILAHHVHREIRSDEKLKKQLYNISLENLGIWIDPIDSTAEYIKGVNYPFKEKSSAISKSEVIAGLCCVTILVGVFDIKTGLPVAGVINQPFSTMIQSNTASTNPEYKGDIFYGIVEDRVNNLEHSIEDPAEPLQKVCVSLSDASIVFSKLEAAGIEPIYACGAGFKALIVAIGYVQAYVCTKKSTYMWDMCAPHAVLLSMGGGIISASKLILFKDAAATTTDHMDHQLKYIPITEPNSSAITPYCNSGGVIAYKHPSYLNALAKALY